jgi:hypothetical protein
MDQTQYVLPSGPGDPTPRQVEGASSRWQQLAIAQTRGQCRALLQARIRDAARRDGDEDRKAPGNARRRYRDQYRYFCSPATDDDRK